MNDNWGLPSVFISCPFGFCLVLCFLFSVICLLFSFLSLFFNIMYTYMGQIILKNMEKGPLKEVVMPVEKVVARVGKEFKRAQMILLNTDISRIYKILLKTCVMRLTHVMSIS